MPASATLSPLVVEQRHDGADAERPAEQVDQRLLGDALALGVAAPIRSKLAGRAAQRAGPSQAPVELDRAPGPAPASSCVAWMARSSACCSAVSSCRRLISFSVASRRRRRMTSWPCTALMADSTLVLAVFSSRAERSPKRSRSTARRWRSASLTAWSSWRPGVQGCGESWRLRARSAATFGRPVLQFASSLVEGLVQRRLQSFEPGRPAPPGEDVVDRGNSSAGVSARALASPVQAAKALAGLSSGATATCGTPSAQASAIIAPLSATTALAPATAAARSTGLVTRSGSLGRLGVPGPVLGLVTALLGLGPARLEDRLDHGVLRGERAGRQPDDLGRTVVSGPFGKPMKGQLEVCPGCEAGRRLVEQAPLDEHVVPGQALDHPEVGETSLESRGGAGGGQPAAPARALRTAARRSSAAPGPRAPLELWRPPRCRPRPGVARPLHRPRWGYLTQRKCPHRWSPRPAQSKVRLMAAGSPVNPGSAQDTNVPWTNTGREPGAARAELRPEQQAG